MLALVLVLVQPSWQTCIMSEGCSEKRVSRLDCSQACFDFVQPRRYRYCFPNPRQLINIFIGLSEHATDNAASLETHRFNGFRLAHGDIGFDRDLVQVIWATRQGRKGEDYPMLRIGYGESKSSVRAMNEGCARLCQLIERKLERIALNAGAGVEPGIFERNYGSLWRIYWVPRANKRNGRWRKIVRYLPVINELFYRFRSR